MDKKMLMFVALAFAASFTAAYLAANWVVRKVIDSPVEQVGTHSDTAVVSVEC